MRVGLVIYGNLDTLSGGYLYDRKLVEHLRAAGDTVEVISVPWRSYGRRLTDNLSPELYRRLSQADVDVLLQDELNHPSLFLLNRRLRGRIRYPVISIVHHLRCSESRPAWQNALYRQVERLYLAGVDSLIVNSRTTRDAVAAALGGAVKLPSSVLAYPAGDRLKPEVTCAGIEERAWLPGPLGIVFVGNVIERKGLHFLIEALAKVPVTAWRLTVVGNANSNPAYANRVRRLIDRLGLASRVTFLGPLSDLQLAAALANHHILAVPSSYEGFGIAYLEAMGFGLPAIATTMGAAGEIITDGCDGFLVPPENPAGLARRIAELAGDRNRLANMGIAALSRYRSHPSWDDSMALIRSHLYNFALVRHQPLPSRQPQRAPLP